MLKKPIAALCCLLLLSGCASPPVAKRVVGDRQDSPIHGMTVAVVSPRYLNLSFKDKPLKEVMASQQSMAAAGSSGPSGLRLFIQSVYEPEKLYRGIVGVFYQDFKSVTMVDSVSDPRIGLADIIAVPEIYFGVYPPNIGAVIAACEFTLFLACLFPWTTNTKTHVTTAFYSPDRSLVAKIETPAVEVKRRKMPLADQNLDTVTFPIANAHVADRLDAAFLESTELRQYAANLKSKSLAQGKPAPEQARAGKMIESDVDRPSYQFEDNTHNYAVIIGVESYANVPAVKYAKRDAEAVRAHLRALGYPGQNIVALTDAQATGSKVKSYLESWLPRNVTPESRVFVFFAGHGAPDAETKQAYLMPWDGDPQYVSDTGYPLKRLYEKLNELKAKEVVVAMDSGFSGSGGRSTIAKGARPLVTEVNAPQGSELGKIILLSAASGDEVTTEEDDQGHGLFTYFLLKSFNEAGGTGTIAQAYDRLKPNVQSRARLRSISQTPALLGSDSLGVSLR